MARKGSQVWAMGLLVSVLCVLQVKRVKAHDFYRIGAGRDEATTPQTTWSGSSVSSPGAAAAGCLESEGSTRAPRAQSEHQMPRIIRNASVSTTPTTTGHSLPLLCFFFDPPWSPAVASSAED